MNGIVSIRTDSYTLPLSEKRRFEAYFQDGCGAIILSPRSLLLHPSVDCVPSALDQFEIAPLLDNSHGMCCVRWRRLLSDTRNGWVENTLYAEERRLVVGARSQLDGAHALEKWEIAPTGAMASCHCKGSKLLSCSGVVTKL